MSEQNILIVEDEVLIAKNIERTLIKNGFNVIGINSSGTDALLSFSEKKPDLVLMDIHIDGSLNGIETASIISEKHDIPVVFLTAHSDKDTFEKAKQTHPFGYLTKPFDERLLLMTIEVAIFRDRSEKEKKKLREEIQVLKGMLPICASCKNIRDDKGYWIQVEQFFAKNTGVDFTHSICPGCHEKLYGDVLRNNKK